jgi:uncharacterized protein YciI
MPLVLWWASLAFGTFGLAQPANVAPQARPMKTYLVVLKAGPAWLPGKPVLEQPLEGHGPYILSLYKKGVLKFAGPFLDGTGGAYVFEAASEEDADAIVAADPAVISKVFAPERHPWLLVDWEKRARATATPSPRP